MDTVIEKPLVLRHPFFSRYLTKYMSLEVASSFLSGTLIILFVALLFQAVRLMEFVVIHQVPLRQVGNLCLCLGLSFIPLAVPLAFFLAVLLGVSRANSEGEILALQVNGMSLRQIFAPLGIFSVLVSFVCLYLSLWTVPQGNRQFELLVTKLGSERIISTFKPGVFMDGFYGMVLFTEHIVPIKNELKRVFIYDRREAAHPLAISAQAGILKNQPEKGLLTLRLTNGSIHVENPQAAEEDVQQKIDFDVYDINLELGEKSEAWRGYSPPSYNFDQLKQRIKDTEPDLQQNRTLRVEYHRRFAMSFCCIVFAALGFAVAILSQRGIRSSALILCFAMGTIYWAAFVGANALAVSGWVTPWLGIWFPNFFFLGIAYLCYRRYVGG